MADEAPANKAASTPQNKGQKVYTLTTPDGRKYRTPDLAEAEHLTRTRGYKLTK